MILIISDPVDAHVRLIEQRLKEKGARVVRLDLAEVPREAAVSSWLEDGAPTRIAARRERGDFDLSQVTTVWFRRCHAVKPDPELAPEDKEFVNKEATAMLMSLALTLGDRFCVNPIALGMATDRGNGKVSQLDVARKRGLSIPRTLATNDPEAARDFLRSCPEGAIYKPFVPPTRIEDGPGGEQRVQTIFTTKLDADSLAKVEGVRFAPCLFQEYVAKKLELRVTVMGNKVFATEIHSQVSEKSAIDFRAHYDLANTPYFTHELPRDLVEKLLHVHRDLGLVFGAYDFILTPEGKYVFLEVNQQGQFLWLEGQTGQPLLENFCELLIQARPDFVCDAEPHEPGLPDLPDLDPVSVRQIAEAERASLKLPARGRKAKPRAVRVQNDARRAGGRRREKGTGKGKESKQLKGKGKGKGQ